jgi:large subunit ribosomal protein L23
MAIFKKKAESSAKEVKAPAVKAAKVTKKTESALGSRVNALVRPHITEKAALLAEKGTYVFEVSASTNKIEIAKAVSTLYGVTPVRVNIINLPRTNVVVRGKSGTKSGVRKALVTLAKGDKIELM